MQDSCKESEKLRQQVRKFNDDFIFKVRACVRECMRNCVGLSGVVRVRLHLCAGGQACMHACVCACVCIARARACVLRVGARARSCA